MRFWTCALLVLALASCGGPAGPLGRVLGAGGTSVAANTQAGRTNNQVIGGATITEQSLRDAKAETIHQSADRNRVRADRVERIEVVEKRSYEDLIIAALLLLLDSPARWPGQIARAISSAWRSLRGIPQAQ